MNSHREGGQGTREPNEREGKKQVKVTPSLTYELRSHQVRSYGLFLEKIICFGKDVYKKRFDSTLVGENVEIETFVKHSEMTKLGFFWTKCPEKTFILDVCRRKDSNRKYKHEDD